MQAFSRFLSAIAVENRDGPISTSTLMQGPMQRLELEWSFIWDIIAEVKYLIKLTYREV